MGNQNMGLTLNQEIFLGITFVVIIIIMILVKDKIMAILIVGLIANFLAISSQLILINERHLQNQSGKNGFENIGYDPPSVTHRDPLLVEQFNNKYDLFRESCDSTPTLTDQTNDMYDSYEGKIDIMPNGHNKKGMLDKIMDTNNIGYDSDSRVVREKIIRNDNERVNPKNNNHKLIKKYIIPEVIEEEKKPWWG
jgi:hypothetical protein